MKRIAILFGVIFCAMHAHAATCPISSGASQSTIASTITGCASPNTVTFASGSYTMSSRVVVPCGVNITGPTATLAVYTGGDGYVRMGYAPSAVISWSGSNSSGPFSWSSCSTAHSIQYVEINMNHPTPDGGQALYFASGQSNTTIFGNYFHGNQGSSSSTNTYDGLVYFDGNSSSTVDSNNVVEWNRFGATGDCSNIMSDITYGGYSGNGGYCNGLGVHNGNNGWTVANNVFYYMEQGSKIFEATGVCLGTVFKYNDYSNIHRIAHEMQCNQYPGTTTNISLLYNSVHDPFHPNNGTFAFSSANGCSNNNPSSSGCVTHTDYNVLIDNVPAVSSFNGLGIEMFGSTGTTSNYNLVQGQWSNSISAALDGSEAANGNHVQSSYGASGSNDPTKCKLLVSSGSNYGWFGWNNEPGQVGVNTPPAPTVANTCDFFDGSVQTSVAPTISPASGSFTGSQTVTLTNPGTNRDVNTSIWYCVTSGCTPSAGGSGSILYTAPFSVTTTTTVKAIGMWGAANQPFTYATGPVSGTFGYKASAAVTATYTTGGATAATPTFSPGSSSFSGTVSVTISTTTPSATLYYCITTGCTPTTSSTLYTGPVSVSSTTTIKAIATASGFSNSAAGTATYTQATTATPILSPPSQSFTTSLSVTIADATPGASIYYCITSGCTPTTSSTPYTGAINLTSTTTINAIAAASGYLNSSVGSGSYTLSAATLTGCTMTTSPSVTTLTVGGATTQLIGQCAYSSGPSPLACSPTADANGSVVTVWGTSDSTKLKVGIIGSGSPGVASGVLGGTANATAQVGSTVCTPAYAFTINNPAVTGVVISLQTGGTTVAIGSPTQACGTISYSGSVTPTFTCGVGPDIYGTSLSSFASSTGNATMSGTGLLSGVSVGSTNITVHAGSFTSPALAITIVNPSTGPNSKLSGPQQLQGGVLIQ